MSEREDWAWYAHFECGPGRIGSLRIGRVHVLKRLPKMSHVAATATSGHATRLSTQELHSTRRAAALWVAQRVRAHVEQLNNAVAGLNLELEEGLADADG